MSAGAPVALAPYAPDSIFRAMSEPTPDKIRSAWVRYLLALRGQTFTAAAERAGVKIAQVNRVVAAVRGGGEAEAPTAAAVWSALRALTGQPLDVLQHPPRVLPPELARELSMLTRDG